MGCRSHSTATRCNQQTFNHIIATYGAFVEYGPQQEHGLAVDNIPVYDRSSTERSVLTGMQLRIIRRCIGSPGKHWCYKLQVGDTIDAVAARFAVDPAVLCTANSFPNGNVVDCGKVRATEFLSIPVTAHTFGITELPPSPPAPAPPQPMMDPSDVLFTSAADLLASCTPSFQKQNEWACYQVEKDDNMYTIAAQYHTSPSMICDYNINALPSGDCALIQPGQWLRVPPTCVEEPGIWTCAVCPGAKTREIS